MLGRNLQRLFRFLRGDYDGLMFKHLLTGVKRGAEDSLRCGACGRLPNGTFCNDCNFFH